MQRRLLVSQAHDLSHLTRELSRCCLAKEEQLFKRFGLSCAEGRLLLCVADMEPTTATAVAARLGLSKGRLSPLVESLVRRRLLSRTESGDDRRTNELAVTASGQELSRAAAEYQAEFHEQLLRRFGREERRQMLDMLRSLHHAMEELRGQMSV